MFKKLMTLSIVLLRGPLKIRSSCEAILERGSEAEEYFVVL